MTSDQQRYFQAKSCDIKRAYPKEEAEKDPYWDIYQCRFCGLWHRSTPPAVKTLTEVRRAARWHQPAKAKKANAGKVPARFRTPPSELKRSKYLAFVARLHGETVPEPAPIPKKVKYGAIFGPHPCPKLFPNSLYILSQREWEENG